MAACSKWRDKLLDHAAGGEAADGLIEHVKTCDDCAEALAGWRNNAGRLDALLGSMLHGKKPAPGFDRRVLAAARDARHKPRQWIWAAAATACVALFLALIFLPKSAVPGGDEPPWEAAATIASWSSPTEFLLEPPLRGAILETPSFGGFQIGSESFNGSVGDEDERQ
jgi:hypothetical protein